MAERLGRTGPISPPRLAETTQQPDVLQTLLQPLSKLSQFSHRAGLLLRNTNPVYVAREASAQRAFEAMTKPIDPSTIAITANELIPDSRIYRDTQLGGGVLPTNSWRIAETTITLAQDLLPQTFSSIANAYVQDTRQYDPLFGKVYQKESYYAAAPIRETAALLAEVKDAYARHLQEGSEIPSEVTYKSDTVPTQKALDAFTSLAQKIGIEQSEPEQTPQARQVVQTLTDLQNVLEGAIRDVNLEDRTQAALDAASVLEIGNGKYPQLIGHEDLAKILKGTPSKLPSQFIGRRWRAITSSFITHNSRVRVDIADGVANHMAARILRKDKRVQQQFDEAATHGRPYAIEVTAEPGSKGKRPIIRFHYFNGDQSEPPIALVSKSSPRRKKN